MAGDGGRDLPDSCATGEEASTPPDVAVWATRWDCVTLSPHLSPLCATWPRIIPHATPPSRGSARRVVGQGRRVRVPTSVPGKAGTRVMGEQGGGAGHEACQAAAAAARSQGRGAGHEVRQRRGFHRQRTSGTVGGRWSAAWAVRGRPVGMCGPVRGLFAMRTDRVGQRYSPLGAGRLERQWKAGREGRARSARTLLDAPKLAGATRSRARCAVSQAPCAAGCLSGS